MTIGAYLAINYLRLKIPEDISVIGFDNFPLANVVNPPLSFAEHHQPYGNRSWKQFFTKLNLWRLL